MKKLLATTAVGFALAASPAMAGDDTDINQALAGLQQILQEIDVNHNNSNISQVGTNLGNVIDVKVEDSTLEDLDDVNQFSATIQGVTNSLDTVYGQWNNTEQSGTNIQNMLNVDDANVVNQAAIALQGVQNSTEFSQWVDGLEQTGLNGANLVTSDDVRESVSQSVSVLSDQAILNEVTIDGLAGDQSHIDGLTQDATNLANVVDGDVFGDIDQVMAGDQVATNLAEFGAYLDGTDAGDSVQTGLNAANLATVGNFDTVRQTLAFTTSQAVVNTAEYVGTGNQWTDGSLDGFGQSGTNLANILTAAELPSTNGVLEVSQVGFANQSVTNVLDGMGGLNGIAQSATNAANLVSID